MEQREVFSHRPGRTPLLNRNTPIKNNYLASLAHFFVVDEIILKLPVQFYHLDCAELSYCGKNCVFFAKLM